MTLPFLLHPPAIYSRPLRVLLLHRRSIAISISSIEDATQLKDSGAAPARKPDRTESKQQQRTQDHTLLPRCAALHNGHLRVVRRGGRGRRDGGAGGAPQRRAPGVRPTGHRRGGAKSGRRGLVAPLRRRRDGVRGPRRRRGGRPGGGAPGGADLLRAPRRDAAPPPRPRRGRRARGPGQLGARQGRGAPPAIVALPPPPPARRGGAARVPGPRGGVRDGGPGRVEARGCGGGASETEGGVPGREREGVQVLPRPDRYPGERVVDGACHVSPVVTGRSLALGRTVWSRPSSRAPEIDGAGSVVDAELGSEKCE
jgi:hypothetical protein